MENEWADRLGDGWMNKLTNLKGEMLDNDGDNGGDDARVGERCLSAPRPTARASPGAETGPYLLQVVKLHRDLPEEEVDVAAPLHRVHEVGLWRRGGGGALLLRRGRDMG